MNNEHKEALQQLLQGANVNIHQLVVGDSTQTIENLIMGDCTQNYYGSSHDEPRLAPDDEEIKQALTELLEAKTDEGKPMMKTQTQWYAVYRVLYEYCNYPKKMTDFDVGLFPFQFPFSQYYSPCTFFRARGFFMPYLCIS